MLKLENISYEIQEEKGQKGIIHHVDLTINDNEFVVITGPNGGGKSTLAKLIAGITAKAELLIREAEDAFVVPTTALLDEGDTTYILIVQDMKIKRIPVTLGVDGDVSVEVITADGTVLEEGMQVVMNPGPHLIDGTDVIVRPQ